MENEKPSAASPASKKKIGTLIKAYSGSRKTKNGDYYDVVLLVYRDESGNKKTLFYDRPEVSYWLIKDKESAEASNPPMYIESKKVQEVRVYSDLLYRDVASKTNAISFYESVLSAKGPKARDMRNLFKHPWVYGADMDLCDRYIAKFQSEYDPDPNYRIRKCYFDIEVDLLEDGLGTPGYSGFPDEELAPCPVNVVTLIDGYSRTVWTFVNDNAKNSSLQQLKGDIPAFQKEVAAKIKAEDGLDVSVNVVVCPSELKAIESFFAKVHEIDPDYIMGWNYSFDVITLMNRLKKLYRGEIKNNPGFEGRSYAGEDDAEDEMLLTVCDEKYSHQKAADGVTDVWLRPQARYWKNDRKRIGTRLDEFTVLDGITWIDQMLYYAVIHFSEGKRDSYRLDAIADFELGKAKLEFAPGETLKNLPWKNFRKFATYNIQDALLLLLIEEKTLDVDLLQRLSEITNTRKEKVFSKSISLPNFINKFAIENGYVMGDNKNAEYGDYDRVYDADYRDVSPILDSDPAYTAQINHADKFGALVSDPNLIDPVGMEMPGGRLTNRLFESVCDQDLSSLYPSILRTLNLDPSTEIGKFILIDPELKSKLKRRYGYSGLFKLSEKDDGAGQLDDVAVPGDTDSDPVDYSDDEGESEVSDAAETNDLGPTLVDEIESQNWCRLGEKYMDLPSAEDNIRRIGEIVAARKGAGK